MTRTLDLAVIAGDGIGPEVVAEGLKVLDAVLAGSDITVATTPYELGAKRWHATGETLTEADLTSIAKHEAILLGAIGDPGVPSGVLERGLLLKLRFAFDHYVNLRPSVLYPGVPTPLANPGEVDFVVVREGTEGPYVGNGGAIRVGTPAEVANEVSVNTAYGVERVVRDAFARAQARPRRKLTLVHKHNVLVHAGHLWRRTVEAVATEFPDVTVDYCHVDAATIYLVNDPARFDVIGTDNLLGDSLTDLADAPDADLPRQQLFAPLGLTSATMEVDATGTPVCSSYLWATPRDWATIGQFALQDGVWAGERLVPEGWMAASTTIAEVRQTEEEGYAAGWWVNKKLDGTLVKPDLPEDAYWASGHDGQRLYVVPSADLVVVRLGFTPELEPDQLRTDELVAELVALTPAEG